MLSLDIMDLEIQFSGLEAPALDIANFTLESGQHLAITGPSGCGKTTFINVLAGFTKPDKGAVKWGNSDIYTLSQGKRDKWRGKNIGLIMQDFHLFQGLSAIDNVLLPLALSGLVRADDKKRALELLERTNLKKPERDIKMMSRGEMQRVAVARALLRKPDILLADEPTASLDGDNGKIIGDLIQQLGREENTSLIIVTHDIELAKRMDRRLELNSGRIVKDERL
ncbi:ABC transporter ATP-binding protein [Bartonella sp. HY761]|uniref:ABC transporter ATP-binding protein n=1 Tax=Bartonella sp. HY761 TaxID=2979330 RepID=UPI0021FA916D|nr:ABC transporter ATP-binding protein [Bartonella sp. HY761]UXN06870.1 ABC transporter ATP-binding protein [Bartonella sp. HY761]